MPELISLPTFSDSRGNLTVVEKILPFDIKRVYYIYGVDNSIRGQHRHINTIQAAICINGSCTISIDNNIAKQDIILDSPVKCLLLYPEDYHFMYDFSENAILLVFASEYYNPKDYIYEPYK